MSLISVNDFRSLYSWALKVFWKAGQPYAAADLVAITSPEASSVRVKTPSGIMAWRVWGPNIPFPSSCTPAGITCNYSDQCCNKHCCNDAQGAGLCLGICYCIQNGAACVKDIECCTQYCPSLGNFGVNDVCACKDIRDTTCVSDKNCCYNNDGSYNSVCFFDEWLNQKSCCIPNGKSVISGYSYGGCCSYYFENSTCKCIDIANSASCSTHQNCCSGSACRGSYCKFTTGAFVGDYCNASGGSTKCASGLCDFQTKICKCMVIRTDTPTFPPVCLLDADCCSGGICKLDQNHNQKFCKYQVGTYVGMNCDSFGTSLYCLSGLCNYQTKTCK